MFSSLRPQAFNLTAKMDELNFPICKLNLFNFDPSHKNFITCMAVKHAETTQRTPEPDQIYVGYLDGTILLCKMKGDLLYETVQIFKGKPSS